MGQAPHFVFLMVLMGTSVLAFTRTWDAETADQIARKLVLKYRQYGKLLMPRGVEPACAFTPIDICANREVYVEKHCSYIITSPKDLSSRPPDTKLNCYVRLGSLSSTSFWLELRTLSLAPLTPCTASSKSRLTLGKNVKLKQICGPVLIQELTVAKEEALFVYNLSRIDDFTMTFSIHVFPQ